MKAKNGHTPNEQEVISFINAYLSENDFIEGVFMARTMPKNIKWEPPDGNIIKINFDASFQ
ncbi:reverse transcriptase [Gossypium australe]|uniref:Reverse transcriptase n=1 Tax=Gossypium australe TaxID=47621 RepID=A0A5B6WZK3_9ROSI|nr:reverse transcriptase [Gossypium australe]